MDELLIVQPEVVLIGPNGEELRLQPRIFADEDEYEASVAEELARFGIVEEPPVDEEEKGAEP